MIKNTIPVILGAFGSSLAAVLGKVDFFRVASADWIGLPVKWNETVFGLLQQEMLTDPCLSHQCLQ